MEILRNHNLKNYNSFGIDVNAKYFVEINTHDDIYAILDDKVFKENNFVLKGEGSNILFTKDFDGIVLKINCKGIRRVNPFSDSEFVYLKSSAGENWDDFVKYTIENNYYGLENLSGIPGNVGSSPIQNIGAYGSELKDFLYEVEAISVETGEIRIFTNAECEFGYRDSVFKSKLKNKYIILSVVFQLSKILKPNLSYEDLRKEYYQSTDQVTAIKLREMILKIRHSKLPDPAVLGNAGSFFKNPVVDETQFKKLIQKYPSLKYYKTPVTNNEQQKINYKLSAAWLIDQAGWKGKKIGNTGTYHQQPLIIINYGNASGMEILEFAEQIKLSVMAKFGISLDFEVNVY